MSKITINVPLEGAKTATTDLTDADSAWISASSNIDGTNIREEGLDRRVIKSTAWTTETGSGGMDNFYASGTCTLQFTSPGTVQFENTDGFHSASGGVSAPYPIIKKYWKANKTAGILVRCSFIVQWDTLGLMSDLSKNQTTEGNNYANQANTEIRFALFRSLPGGSMATISSNISQNTMVASQSLSRVFASQYASGQTETPGGEIPEGNYLDISNPYDRRSNLYSSITLVDSFLPGDPESDVDGDVYWRLKYRAPCSYTFPSYTAGDGDAPSDTAIKTLPKISDINFAAHKFVR